MEDRWYIGKKIHPNLAEWAVLITDISKMANFYIALVMFLGRYGVPFSKFEELLPGYFFPIELPFYIGVLHSDLKMGKIGK